MEPCPTIADYHAYDVARAFIEKRTHGDGPIAHHYANDLDRAFRQLAADLGYEVSKQDEAEVAA